MAIEPLRGEKTLTQLRSKFKVHPIQIAEWRKTTLDHLPESSVGGRRKAGANREMESTALYEEIGRRKEDRT
jgi:transposase